MYKIVVVLLFISALEGATPGLPACFPTPISSATTISTPGAYNLTTNITGTITITADNVDCDLCNYEIDAGGAANAMSVTGNNVTVHNGTVTGASSEGLLISGTENVLLNTIRALSNTAIGIGLSATNTCCTILNCTATGNATGFQDLGSFATRIERSSACNNSSDGFELVANQLLARDICAKENGTDGIQIRGNNFTIRDFQVLNNGNNGLHIESLTGVSSSNGACERGMILGNGSNGIFLDADTTDITQIIVNECTINSNVLNGISLDAAASGAVAECQICENKIVANGSNGIVLTVSASQTARIQIVENQILRNGVGIAGPVFGINIGGGVFVAGGAGATATTHEIFSNKALQNGTNAPGATTTNYSNNVQASPASGPANPNGLVVAAAAGVGFIENISS